MLDFLKKWLGGSDQPAMKKCFFEKDQTCDQVCRAYSEQGTCSIVDRLRQSKDSNECAAALRALRNIDKDPDTIARDFPDLFPPPKLFNEGE